MRWYQRTCTANQTDDANGPNAHNPTFKGNAASGSSCAACARRYKQIAGNEKIASVIRIISASSLRNPLNTPMIAVMFPPPEVYTEPGEVGYLYPQHFQAF